MTALSTRDTYFFIKAFYAATDRKLKTKHLVSVKDDGSTEVIILAVNLGTAHRRESVLFYKDIANKILYGTVLINKTRYKAENPDSTSPKWNMVAHRKSDPMEFVQWISEFPWMSSKNEFIFNQYDPSEKTVFTVNVLENPNGN